jgi:hypothetical protein
LAYLWDIYTRLNELILGLQGLSATIFNVRDKIEAMIKKLGLWSYSVNKNDTQVYRTILFAQTRLRTADSVKFDLEKHLVYSYARTSPETDNRDNWICFPFSSTNSCHPPISE